MSHTTTSSTSNIRIVAGIVSKLEFKENDLVAFVKLIFNLAESTEESEESVACVEQLLLLADIKALLNQIESQFGKALSQEDLQRPKVKERVSSIRSDFDRVHTQSGGHPAWERIEKLIEAMEILTSSNTGSDKEYIFGGFLVTEELDDDEECLIEGGH